MRTLWRRSKVFSRASIELSTQPALAGDILGPFSTRLLGLEIRAAPGCSTELPPCSCSMACKDLEQCSPSVATCPIPQLRPGVMRRVPKLQARPPSRPARLVGSSTAPRPVGSLHLALLGPRAWSSEALAGRLAPIRLHFSSSEPPKPSPGDTVKQLLVYRILSSLVPGGIGRSRFGPLYRSHAVCAATCGSTGITGGLGSVRNTAVCFRTLGLRSNYSVDRGWV